MPTKAQLIESGERLTCISGDVTMYAEKRDGYLGYTSTFDPVSGDWEVKYHPDFYTIAYHRSSEMMPAYHTSEFETLAALISEMRKDDLRRWSIVRFEE